MYRGSRPRILPIIVVIVIVALVVAAIVTVGRMLFSGSGDTSQDNKKTTSSVIEQAVLAQDSDRAVRWTVRGPIVGDEKFRSYQIIISPSTRTYITYSGYLDQVIDTKSYSNNVKAYEQFVYALNKTDIAKARDTKDADLRGVCATNGLAYEFETLVNDDPDHVMWSSTCKDSQGTMTADPLQVQALFVNQIPDFHPLFTKIY
jgi:hypothetical protein